MTLIFFHTNRESVRDINREKSVMTRLRGFLSPIGCGKDLFVTIEPYMVVVTPLIKDNEFFAFMDAWC